METKGTNDCEPKTTLPAAEQMEDGVRALRRAVAAIGALRPRQVAVTAVGVRVVAAIVRAAEVVDEEVVADAPALTAEKRDICLASAHNPERVAAEEAVVRAPAFGAEKRDTCLGSVRREAAEDASTVAKKDICPANVRNRGLKEAVVEAEVAAVAVVVMTRLATPRQALPNGATVEVLRPLPRPPVNPSVGIELVSDMFFKICLYCIYHRKCYPNLKISYIR